MFLAQGNDRLDRWWWNTALPTQPETKASSSAAVKIAPSVQKDINRHGVMWRSGGWDCSSWEISDQAHEKLQHILNMIKERIGNAIRTRRLAYAVRTCTQWMCVQRQLMMCVTCLKLITWWDPEAGICTRCPSGPSAHTGDACGSGHHVFWWDVCSCNRPDETRVRRFR